MSQADILIKLCEGLILFHDQHGVGFAFLDGEAIPLRSKNIRQYLAKLLWEKHDTAASSETLTQALNVLEATAVFSSPEVFLFNRVGKGTFPDDFFYYDLGNGKVVKIGAGGWSVLDAPIMFRRYTHQRSQVTPVAGGDPWAIFEFINVESEYRLLILCYLISCFVPDISHPVIHPYGDQGAGKTTACTMLRDIIDPSDLKAQSIPKNLNELIQVLAHHYFPVFDNLTSLPDWASDALSQGCTGGGLSKRKLYTDEDDVVLSFKRPITLNGINVVVHKADLMDRSILFPLERISPDRRKRENELWAEFQRMKPSLLGGIFDTLARSMGIFPSVRLSWTPRMADFGSWGYAIAEALEKGKGEKFIEDYRKNIDRQIEEVLQANALAQGVLSFMDKQKGDLKSTVGEAWKLLYTTVGEPRNDPTFPKSERTLKKALAVIKPGLQHHGIFYEIYPRTKNGYPILFTRNPEELSSFASSSLESSNKIKTLSGELKGEAKTKKRAVGSPDGSLNLEKSRRGKANNQRTRTPKN